MILTEKKMDLFELSKEYVLVHCISLDCAMGAGMAKVFDKKFPNMKWKLADCIKGNNLKHPISILYGFERTVDNKLVFVDEKQGVINMITKEKYWHKPTYEDFNAALLHVAYLCKKYNIKKLGMPKIGCGLDRLQWDKVKEKIEDYFKDLDIEIVVCYL